MIDIKKILDEKMGMRDFFNQADENKVISAMEEYASQFKKEEKKTELKPYRCPICMGTKIVPGGFYTSTTGSSISSAITEPCQQCGGTGIIYS